MFLFKYLSSNRIDVLENKEIRFTQPKYLNDQYEALPRFNQLFTNEGFDKYLLDKIDPDSTYLVESVIKDEFPFLTAEQVKVIAENDNFKEIIRKSFPFLLDKIKSVLVGTDTDWLIESSLSIKEAASNSIGILSLSEVFDSQTMWAHYAENSKGFLIVFDTNNIFFDQRINESDQIRFIRPVKYSIERPLWPTIDKNTDETSFEPALHQILLTKHCDWEKEREWRMILPLKNANKIIGDNIHLYKFPPSCITEIILGPCIEIKTKELILNLISNDPELSHIKVKQGYINESYSIGLKQLLSNF